MHMHVYLYVYTFVYMCLYIYVCIYIYVSVYVSWFWWLPSQDSSSRRSLPGGQTLSQEVEGDMESKNPADQNYPGCCYKFEVHVLAVLILRALLFLGIGAWDFWKLPPMALGVPLGSLFTPFWPRVS